MTEAPPAAPEAAAAAAAPASASPAPAVRAALAIFALVVVACFLLYAALTVPGAWFPSASERTFTPRELGLTRGTGALDRDALVIRGTDESGLALVTANSDLRSTEYPVVAWRGSGFPENADVRFLWRSDYAPNKLNTMQVPVVAGRLAPVTMAKNPEWIGRITGIALAVRGPLPEPVRIDGVTIRAGGAVGQLGERFREWTAFEPWNGASINTITGGAEVQEVPLPTFLVAGVVLAVAIWFGIAWKRGRTFALPVVIALLFVVAWVLVDAAWTWNLARQVAATRDQYGGKDWRDRHLAAEDGPLFAFVEKARAKLPAAPARVFVVADAPYFRGRAAYHLYPHNVQFDPFANSVPNPAALHAGDWVIVYQRRGVQFNPEEKKLRFEGGPPVSAEAVLVEPGAALFKVL
ncbi:MAG: hypothetical protein U1F10_05740 [Burkholderiales bacterium]